MYIDSELLNKSTAVSFWSTTLSIGSGASGCVLNPHLYTLYTHDCITSHNTVIKFAKPKLSLHNDETTCREEVKGITGWSAL